MEPICDVCGAVHRTGRGYFKSHAAWEAWRDQLAEIHRGRPKTATTRQKLRDANIGNTSRLGAPRDEYFEANIVRESDGCWWWPCGQGRRWVRWAYEHFVGPIPEGMVLDHLCGNGVSAPGRTCLNPFHLDPCTAEENTRRGSRPHFHLRGQDTTGAPKDARAAA